MYSRLKHRSFRFLLLGFLLICLCLPSVSVNAEGRLQQIDKKDIVVVIDPGHGGENHGTTENGYLEKELNMITAKALYDELSAFEGITVYLTHTDDKDYSLKDRAKFASRKKADFLVSIHYNASETHLLYGSEVWVSLQPEYHAYGYQLGTMLLRQMRDLGMNLRGIKTRPSSKGDDYYGIIRESVTLGVPAAIIEHCHVDHPKDSMNCDTREELIAYGVADAHAIAKYFGLKSTSKGVDYSDQPSTLPSVPLDRVLDRAVYDDTAPETCVLTLSEINPRERRVLINVSAADAQSNLIYYDVSMDGGNTYGDLMTWPVGDILTGIFPDAFLLELIIPEGVEPRICLRAYNPYDLYQVSNVLTPELSIPSSQAQPVESEEADLLPEGDLSLPAAGNPSENPHSGLQLYLTILKVFIVIVAVFFVGFLIAYVYDRILRRKK